MYCYADRFRLSPRRSQISPVMNKVYVLGNYLDILSSSFHSLCAIHRDRPDHQGSLTIDFLLFSEGERITKSATLKGRTVEKNFWAKFSFFFIMCSLE